MAKMTHRKLKYGGSQTLILDPSMLAYPDALIAFSKTELSRKYRIVIPTHMRRLLGEEKYDELFDFLRQWEGALSRQKWKRETKHFKWLLENTVSCDAILKELTQEQRKILGRVDKTLRGAEEAERYKPAPLREVTIEIIKTACVTSPILSISKKLKKWASGLKGTIIAKAERSEKLMAAKEGFRDELVRAGWKGKVLIWTCKHFPIPFLGDIVDMVVIAFVDGTYRCPSCGESLSGYALGRGWNFCSQCGFHL